MIPPSAASLQEDADVRRGKIAEIRVRSPIPRRPKAMPIPTDTRLLGIACDVAIRFRAHGTYGDERGALKALRRRAPGHAPGEYLAVFEFLRTVYHRAVEAIPRHLAYRPDKTSIFAEPEDIDFDACMAELDGIEPGLASREKGCILNWCIFWHYLK